MSGNQQSRRWIRRIAALVAVVIVVAVCAGEFVQRRRIETVIASAEEKLGLRYELGAEGPKAYDCSSLVQACFAAAGIETPRNSLHIANMDVYRVEESNRLLRGDVVCWDTVNDRDPCDHVGIYLGGGRVLHASTGRMKVVVDDMEGYFTEHFSWGLRPIWHLPFDLPENAPGEEK